MPENPRFICAKLGEINQNCLVLQLIEIGYLINMFLIYEKKKKSRKLSVLARLSNYEF